METLEPKSPDEIEITPEMIRAGVLRLGELENQTGSDYLVEEVFRAMLASKYDRSRR
jgi:hypothetical protein